MKPHCPNCQKPEALCLCAQSTPLATRLQILILQHPQEPDKHLGTARLAQLNLKNAILRVGLSTPNLRSALGLAKNDPQEIKPSEWAVLYLGSNRPDSSPQQTKSVVSPLRWFEEKGNERFRAGTIKGLVVLDGTWSQAKALWWRNPWLLKLNRAWLAPQEKSLYGALRKEPRKECLSTIESIAVALEALGEPASTAIALRSLFSELLKRYRGLR